MPVRWHTWPHPTIAFTYVELWSRNFSPGRFHPKNQQSLYLFIFDAEICAGHALPRVRNAVSVMGTAKPDSTAVAPSVLSQI